MIVALDTLKPHKRNYNKHPEHQVKRLVASLRKFGQRKPLTTWRNTILTGHGVFLAAQQAGWKEIDIAPCPDEWTEEMALAWLAADNELARLADPDLAQLAEIIEEARNADAELLEAIGFDEAEFGRMLEEMEQTSLRDATPGGDKRLANSDPARKIKAVLYAPDVTDFERAILATGERNRAAALLTICRFYMEAHDAKTSTEGQFDVDLENLLAAQFTG